MAAAMRGTVWKRLAEALAIAVVLPVTTPVVSDALPAAWARPSARPAPAQPAAAAEPKPIRTATLVVVAQDDGSPLPGAVVFVRGTGGRIYNWEGATDEQGRYTIVPPSEATLWFDVVVAPVGYERGFVSTVGHPAPVVVRLKRAEPIGGTVLDDRGRPIAGARVFPMAYRFGRAWPEIEASPSSECAIATTDAQGRWRAEALPAGTLPNAAIRVRVTHPDRVAFVSVTTARQAREGSSVIVMKPGVSLSGTVLSPFGRPVPRATVTVTAAPWDGVFLRLVTDRDGRFRSGRCLDPRSPGLVLLVEAQGLAWTVHHVAVAAEIPPQVIRLGRRRPLEGRVSDDQGRPVEGAVVTTSRQAFGGLLGWEAKTDANGRFVWYDAPTAGSIDLHVSRAGFPPARQEIARPETEEVAITLGRE